MDRGREWVGGDDDVGYDWGVCMIKSIYESRRINTYRSVFPCDVLENS